jgi:endogenous inhibitor of DNA gyrase (YacG/DUF329 family)
LIDFSRWANEEYLVPGQRINPEATEQHDPNEGPENEQAHGE